MKKPKSAFETWFVEQYGKPPAWDTAKIEADLRVAQDGVALLRAKLIAVGTYWAQRDAALKGWVARPKP